MGLDISGPMSVLGTLERGFEGNSRKCCALERNLHIDQTDTEKIHRRVNLKIQYGQYSGTARRGF